MKLKGKISFTRPSRGGDVDQVVSIQIQDCASRINFLEIDVPLEQFALAVTGLSAQACDLTVRGLNRVGTKKVTESREALYTGEHAYNKDKLRAWLIETKQEEGWTLDPYVAHQNAIYPVDGGMMVRYSVYKFVPLEDGEVVDD